jgi:hypothetical protein
MNRKLKMVFLNSNPGASGTTEIPITAIDSEGNVLQGTIHASTLYNWLGQQVSFTPAAGLGGSGESETAARRVG